MGLPICRRMAPALLLAAIGLPSIAAAASPARPAPRPDIRSAAAIVVDARDSSVLFARRDDSALPIASITKLMTAIVVTAAKQPLDETLVITKADRDGTRGSASRLAIGTKLTRRELLHLALMSSENRAAYALGRNYPGGIQAFVKAMNERARTLGMAKSRFADPTGLSAGNVASARDLVRLVKAASADPLIRQFSTDEKHTVVAGKRAIEYRNTNTLVNRPDWDIALQKTGYTLAAGQCLVMNTVIEGRSVVIVLLNSFGKYTRVADARRIRQWMEKSG